jgi:hypothetical protein
MHDQVESLGSLPDVRPPQGDWDVLHARLVSEGFIQKGWLPIKTLAVTPGWMQAAAGMVLFVGGMGLGSAVVRQNAQNEATVTSLAELIPIESPVQPASLGQAEDAVRMAERQYMNALVRYRDMRTAGDQNFLAPDPAGRFAALEALVATSQAAVREAPADPFLNGILISAMAERQAALQRVSGNGEWY